MPDRSALESHSVTSSPVLDYLHKIHKTVQECHEGSIATYIPELGRANPDWFGIALVTTTGEVYEVGDSRQLFTIQSVSKPFVYGLALEDNSRAEVLKKIAVEPTGDAFNAISLESGTGRPRNPMINAGAIAAAGLIAGKTMTVRLRRILKSLSLCAGRDLALDESVYQSEAETGHRNRAIGHMLRNFEILGGVPEPVVDLYFKQCSIAVTCRDLGVMAATLANGGVNPVTGKTALQGEYVESVLSVMASCGMYDYAGEWLYRIGMPAKSGVSGGIIAVLPGQLGIAVFSPRLDARGNSVRGIKVCDAVSRDLNLHVFNTAHASLSSIRVCFTGAEVSSSRKRTPREVRLLRESGQAILAYQLQGKLVFSTTEVLVRDVLQKRADLRYLLLDLKRTLSIDESACRLLYELLQKLWPDRRRVVFTGLKHHPHLRRYLRAKLGDHFDERFLAFDHTDEALEWCENQLLDEDQPELAAERGRAVSREGYELFRGLSQADIRWVGSQLHRRKFRAGDVVIEAGAPASEVFFVASGLAAALVMLTDGSPRRLGVFSPGMSFGEMGLLDGAPRSARIIACTDLVCDVLEAETLRGIEAAHPHIKIVLLQNIALGIAALLRKVNREISRFD